MENSSFCQCSWQDGPHRWSCRWCSVLVPLAHSLLAEMWSVLLLTMVYEKPEFHAYERGEPVPHLCLWCAGWCSGMVLRAVLMCQVVWPGYDLFWSSLHNTTNWAALYQSGGSAARMHQGADRKSLFRFAAVFSLRSATRFASCAPTMGAKSTLCSERKVICLTHHSAPEIGLHLGSKGWRMQGQ